MPTTGKPSAGSPSPVPTSAASPDPQNSTPAAPSPPRRSDPTTATSLTTTSAARSRGDEDSGTRPRAHSSGSNCVPTGQPVASGHYEHTPILGRPRRSAASSCPLRRETFGGGTHTRRAHFVHGGHRDSRCDRRRLPDPARTNPIMPTGSHQQEGRGGVLVVGFLFGWLLLPFRLVRRSHSKREALQKQQLATMQAMLIQQQQLQARA